MELDFAAITAKMSPSLSQSIPTQRLRGAGERGESGTKLKKLFSERYPLKPFRSDKTVAKNDVLTLTP